MQTLRRSMIRKCLSHVSRASIQNFCRLESTSRTFSQTNIKPVECYDSITQFLDSYDTFLIDCDGVLWDSYQDFPIPGIPKAIKKLHDLGKKVVYVTNNSIISRKDLRQKFRKHGFDAPMENIFSNAHTAAVYVKDILKVQGKVYLVGGEGMKWELDQEEVEHFGLGPDLEEPTTDVNKMLKMKFEDNVEAVLVGFDHYVSYNKIYKAASYLTDSNCHFIATNDIERGVFIGEGKNRRMPMVGMIVNAISETAARKPVVMGKPETVIFECLREKHAGIDKSRTVMVGDSLKADIGFARALGIDSALVLSGTSKLEQVNEMPHLVPTYVMKTLADIALS